MPKVVVNTTPLIALANIGKLDLLKQLYGEIYIPNAVLWEIKSQPAKFMVKISSMTKKWRGPRAYSTPVRASVLL